MPYLKSIVCLAASFKTGGVCIAGKEILADGFGSWIRPVSARETAEVLPGECCYRTGTAPKLLDFIHVPLLEPLPDRHQTENHLIDTSQQWAKAGEFRRKHLENVCDSPPSLWLNGSHTKSGGWNNCMEADEALSIRQSLFLIRPETVAIEVVAGIRNAMPIKKCWASFDYNGTHYRLRITDPVVTHAYQTKDSGGYPLDEAYLTVSLAEPYEEDGRCHKLVAAVLAAQQ